MSESISERNSKLYQILNGKSSKKDRYRLFDQESFLDMLFAFYDICCSIENQRKEKHVANFVKRYQAVINEVRSLRVKREDFDTIKIIGRGHFGEVYVVKEKSTNNIYAMKMLKKAATLTNDNVAFYEEERDIMAWGASEWVTTLQYSFQDVEYLYLVMEYLPGGDLLNLLVRYDDETMEEEDAKFYICEIVMAIHAVHVAGYVHRDVKPENILIDRTGHVKLADFGSAARLLNGKTVMCKMPVGTPEYISPEVLQSMNSGGGIYGCECDWWSLGVVCYEILCGELPFEAESVLPLYGAIMNFKNTLKIPEDINLSAAGRSLIVSLLEDQKTRAGYAQLAVHEFFNGMDWTTLKSMKPPYIPQLKDALDTSHFTDFTPTKSTKQPIASSLANTVPFLGYSFTRNLSMNFENSVKAKPVSSPSAQVSPDDIESTKELSRLVSANETLTANITTLNTTISENEKKIKQLEHDLHGLSEEIKQKSERVVQLNNEVKSITEDRNKLKENLDKLSQSESNVDQLNSQIHALNTLLETEKDVTRKLVLENESLKQIISTVKNELDISLKKLKDSEVYWKEYENSQIRIQNELKNGLEESHAQLEKSTNEFKQKQQAALEEARKYRELYEVLEQEKLNNEHVPSNTDTTLTNEEVENLKTKLNESNTKYESIKRELSEIKEKLKNTENDVDDKNVLILKLNQQVRANEINFNELNGKLKESEKTIAAHEAEIEFLKNNSQIVKNTNSELSSVIENQIRKITEITETLRSKEQELTVVRNTNTDRIAALHKEIEALETKVLEKSQNFDTISNRLLIQQSEIAEKNAELARFESEIAKLNQLVSAQKTSNFNLSQELEQVKATISRLENENEEILAKQTRDNAMNREKIYKLEETVSQQTKLINFLHQTPKKKTKKSDMDHAPLAPAPQANTSRNARDVSQQLEFERTQNLRLNNELNQIKADFAKLKLEFSKQSSPTGVSNLSPKSPEHRTSSASLYDAGDQTLKNDHNIVVGHCLMPTICVLCLAPISYLKNTISCKSCKVIAHANCSDFMTTFPCSHFTVLSSIDIAHDPSLTCPPPMLHIDESGVSDSDASKPILTGYLSIPVQILPNKYDWHKKWFELTESKMLIKNDDDTQTLFAEFPFSKFQSCKILPTIHTSDLAFTSVANVPCIFGLEFTSEFAQEFYKSINNSANDTEFMASSNNIFLLLAPTIEEKREWVRMFSAASAVNSPKPDIPPMYSFPITNLTNISSVVFLSDEIFLIGYRHGIMLVNTTDNVIVKCTDDNKQCHQLYLEGSFLFGIYGDTRLLSKIKRDKTKNIHEVSQKHPKLSIMNFPEFFDVLAILLVETTSDTAKVFLTTSETIVCVKVHNDVGSKLFAIPFEGTPPSSIIVHQNTCFISQDKFYTIDLDKKTKTLFLDSNDHTLAFAIFGSTETANYPMNIFKIVRGNTCEFLICCSEFGTVVDIHGRRLYTNDIRWDSIPLEFAFNKNHLFVMYSDKIQVRSFENTIAVHPEIPIVATYSLSFGHLMCFDLRSNAIIACFSSSDTSIVLYRLDSASQNSTVKPLTKKSSAASNPVERHRTFASIFSKKRK